MEILTIANNKGGVSKSTLAKLLAEGLVLRHGKRVLLMDTDSQCNLSESFLPMIYTAGSIYSAIVPPRHPDYEEGSVDWPREYVSVADIYSDQGTDWYLTDHPNLAIIPAESGRLEPNQLREFTESLGEHTALNLMGDWLREVVAPAGAFDVVIIDTPPNRSLLTFSAVRAATGVLIPAEMEKYSISGLTGMFSMISREAALREESHPLTLLGILPTKFQQQSAQHNEFLKALRADPELSPFIPHQVMHYWSAYRLSSTLGREFSVFSRSANDRVRQEAEAIVAFVHQELFNV